jgi:hypothetical protein
VKAPSANKVLVVGIVCGLAAVVLVRVGVALLFGGVKAFIILGLIGAAWLVFGRRPSRQDDR